jgi:hypothetical protein
MERDKKYLEILLKPLRVCSSYHPRMGFGKGNVSLADFQKIYRSDPFYNWFGLDNPLMYAAHKAAGGMTSIYRQIGTGCERLFREILKDELGLSDDNCTWKYTISASNGKNRNLRLDARICLEDVANKRRAKVIEKWLLNTALALDVDEKIAGNLQGVVFEVRQGYKSKDSKRQNADIANAAMAYSRALLPCVLLLSAQIDKDILTRYRNERWAILTGDPVGATPYESTYIFCEKVLGYDLAGFFERNHVRLRREVDSILKRLLSA